MIYNHLDDYTNRNNGKKVVVCKIIFDNLDHLDNRDNNIGCWGWQHCRLYKNSRNCHLGRCNPLKSVNGEKRYRLIHFLHF